MNSIKFLFPILLIFILPVSLFAQNAYKVIVEKANVRSNPSPQSSLLGSLNKGDVITATNVANGWVCFSFKDGNGYISLFSVKKIDVPVLPSSKTGPTSTPKIAEAKDNISPVPTKVQDTQDAPPKDKDSEGKRGKRKPSKNNRKLQNTKVKYGELSLLADVFGGYSSFNADVSPKPGIGFGVDAGIQADYTRFICKIPKNLFGEFAVGYSYKGCAAYPLHCINFRILPISYRYPLSNIKLIGKAGIYLSHSFSDIDTGYITFDTSLDVGFSVGLGAEYRDIGIVISYEHGFNNMLESYRELQNRGAYLTVSYKFKKL